MKKLVILLGLLIGMMGTQSQSLSTLDVASKNNITTHNWTAISSVGEQINIRSFSVVFVADKARLTSPTSVQNHLTRNSYTSSQGKIVKGLLYSGEKVVGTARFSAIGTSIAGTANIDGETYKFRPREDGNYFWAKEDPFHCGTDDVDHNCDVQNPNHEHGEECHHAGESSRNPSAPQMRDPNSCTSESIQDVAFVTDDLMTEYGNDLDAILAQIAISDSWAQDIMEDSGFPDIQFFQESVHVVNFAESGTTYGNLQVFSDSLYVSPAGNIVSIAQGATSWVMTLYCAGGGSSSGVALVSVAPMPSGQYYMSVLGNNGGLGNYVKMHEYGHALWGGEHENDNPNPVLYRRAYLGTDATWGNYASVMARGNFGGGIRIYRFSEDDPSASWYSEGLDHTFSPVGTTDRDMHRRITEEWSRPGIVQTVDITPGTPTISADGPTTFCDGGSVDLDVDSPESGVTYHWTNSTTGSTFTGNSITATTAGDYSCYGEASSTCSGASSNVITVTVNSIPNDPVISTTTPSICDGETATITVDNVESGVTYNWDNGDQGNSIDVTEAGDYTCYGDNGDCQGGTSNTVTITVNSPPSQPSAISGNANPTSGTSETYSVSNVSGVTYSWTLPSDWTGSSTNNSITVTVGTESGTIEVSANNDCGVSSVRSLTVTVSVVPLEVTITSPDTDLCVGDNTPLTAVVTGGQGNQAYLWSTGETTQIITVSPSETTTYSVEVSDGSETVSDDIVVTVHANPVVDIFIDGDSILCQNFGETVTLDAGTGFETYLWDTDETTQTIETDPEWGLGLHEIWCEVTNDNGCTGRDTVRILYTICEGIDDISSDKIINIYPNPTSAVVQINVREVPQQVRIMSTTGKEVFQIENLREMIQVDLSHLPTGMYFVRVLHSNGMLTTHKVVKR